jgi:hypothetical protein
MRFNPPRSGFLGARSADLRAMPAVTRRRYPERQDCWHIYYGDVHVGMIAARCCPQHNHRLSTVLPIYNNRAPQALAAQRSTGKTNGSSTWRSYAIRYFDLDRVSGLQNENIYSGERTDQNFSCVEISGAHRNDPNRLDDLRSSVRFYAGVQRIGLQPLTAEEDFGRIGNFVAASLNRPSQVLVAG